MEIQVMNTLQGRKEPLVPRTPGEISMYVCGVTPYDVTHLGHARPAVVFDCIRRYLRAKGYKVRFVQNFTDVDDKIIARAQERGVDPLALSRTYAEEYLQSISRLGVEPADAYPKVSEHIADIVAFIEGLIAKGFAYEADGDVYFQVAKFPEYGKLSNQRVEELAAGTRFDVDERKRDPMDFALWKKARPGEPSWPSPWGPGRPGWHIECSTMALRYLGNNFDIHGGGIDLVFPHHENEIAQSEAYTGSAPFARYWLHNGLVNLEGVKMSKSLGHYLSVADALEHYPAELLRFYILSHHYRTQVDFAAARLEAVRKGWERLIATVSEIQGADLSAWPGITAVWRGERSLPTDGLGGRVREAAQQFDAAMADDFNTPKAIAVLFDLVRDVRSAQSTATAQELGLALGFLQDTAGALFGVLCAPAERAKPAGEDANLTAQLIDLLVELRAEARQRRDWAQADRIRDRLKELGITLEDTPTGTRWSM